MKYEFKAEDIYKLAEFIGSEIKEHGDEIQFKNCPYCHGGEHDDKYTFAVNRKTGKFNCLRASCSHRGHFVTLARDCGYNLDFGTADREYKKLPKHEILIRPKVVELMAKREISENVCQKYKLTVRKDNTNIIVFPFFDENGQLITVKYRNSKYQKGIDKNKEWFERDTKPILFGMEQANDFSQPLVITEGQIDALSLAECGIPNAVSVPNGCLSFTWVSHCYDWVNKFSTIIVFGDNENGKITLVEEIAKRFKKPIKFVSEKSYYGLKDANDILMQYGKETLFDSFNSAEEYLLPHIKRLSDVKDIDFSTLPRIKTGIPALDNTFGGLYNGHVILLTGRRGEGKSTLMSQLVLEAIDQGYTTLAYSGELTASHFKNWIDFQAAGADEIQNFGTEYMPVYRIKPETHAKITAWYSAKAYIYDNESVYDDELESIIDTIEGAVVRYGINFVCIDNLMTAMDLTGNDDLYRAQSQFVRKLKRIALRYNIVVLLVVHPRKESSSRKNEISDLNNDSVMGSGDIANRADSILIYSRGNADDGISKGELRLTKNRINGKLIVDNPITLIYSESSKRLTPIDASEPKHFGWEEVNAEPEYITELPF